MVKGIVLHSVVPVRAEARETAALETELLFGETCTILQQQDSWSYIQNDSDQQEGWVDSKMISPMSDEEWDTIQHSAQVARVRMPMAYAVSENNGQTIPLTAGTCLRNYQEGNFELLGVHFRIDDSMVAATALEMNQTNLLQVVRFMLNTPYLWGGKNALGMDCSGFTQVVMSLFGCVLPRNAREQAECGLEVGQLADAQAGDLAFFDHDDGKVSHVGILIDRERVVHCSGRVKVEKIDEKGIWNIERGDYSHHLVKMKRTTCR